MRFPVGNCGVFTVAVAFLVGCVTQEPVSDIHPYGAQFSQREAMGIAVRKAEMEGHSMRDYSVRWAIFECTESVKLWHVFFDSTSPDIRDGMVITVQDSDIAH